MTSVVKSAQSFCGSLGWNKLFMSLFTHCYYILLLLNNMHIKKFKANLWLLVNIVTKDIVCNGYLTLSIADFHENISQGQ